MAKRTVQSVLRGVEFWAPRVIIGFAVLVVLIEIVGLALRLLGSDGG